MAPDRGDEHHSIGAGLQRFVHDQRVFTSQKDQCAGGGVDLFHLTHQADALALFKIFGHEQQIGLVLPHAVQCLISGGDGRQKPRPDRHRHAKAGQGQPIPHAGDDRGALQKSVHILEPWVVLARMQVEIHAALQADAPERIRGIAITPQPC